MAFRLVLTAAVVIGGVIETSQSNPRIVLDGPSDTLTVYDSNGNVTVRIGGAFGRLSAIDSPDNEFVTMWNGSTYYGAGDPDAASPFGITTAGQITADLPGLSLFLQSGIHATSTDRASWELFPGVPGATPSSATAKHAELFGDLWQRGYAIYENISGLATWQTVANGGIALGAGWATDSTAGGQQPLQLRLDTEDNLVITGMLHTTSATPAGTLFTVSSQYRPTARQHAEILTENTAGSVQATNRLLISTTGAVTMSPGLAAANIDVYINISVPLGHIA